MANKVVEERLVVMKREFEERLVVMKREWQCTLRCVSYLQSQLRSL